MSSWILIPIYLFQNSLNRWFENLAAPLTKIVVPFLLAVLGFLVLGFLRTAEAELKQQLSKEDLRTIRLTESVFGEDSRDPAGQIEEDRKIWGPYCEVYDSFQQIPVVVQTQWSRQTPVFVYSSALSFLDMPEAIPGEPREVFLFVDGPTADLTSLVELRDTELWARLRKIDPELKDYFSGRAFLLVPLELAEKLMERGYTQIQQLVPKKEIDPVLLERKVRAYSALEERQLSVVSATDFLQRLRVLLEGQKVARWAMAGSLVLILSLVLGSLSLLEFRQEAYLMALLRSFGVGSWLLMGHVFLESLLLTLVGVFFGYLIVENVAAMSLEMLSLQDMGLEAGQLSLLLDRVDLQLIFASAGLGVVFAVIPVLWGLRKRPGLVLS